MAWLPAGEGGSQLNPRRLTCRVPQPDTPMSDPRTTPVSPAYSSTRLNPLAALIFSSRWLQLPLYLGLILAQGVYVVLFMKELWHLVHGATELSEQLIMLAVLGLIDVVMISNLLVMVIVGGYEDRKSTRLNSSH